MGEHRSPSGALLFAPVDIANLLIEHDSVLARIPFFEQNLLLWWMRGESQTRLAHRFGCSQATVNYRLRRSLLRLEVLGELPPFDDDEIGELLLGFPPSDIEIVKVFYRTSSQSAAVPEMATSQGCARHRLVRTTRRLEFWLATADPQSDLAILRRELLDGIKLLQRRPNSLTSIGETHSSKSQLRDVSTEMLVLARSTVVSRTPNAATLTRAEWGSWLHKPQSLDTGEGLLVLLDLLAILRREGPRSWRELCERSPFPQTAKVLKEARRTKAIFVRGPDRVCLLFPRAARTFEQSFEINWTSALKTFCSFYLEFSTNEALHHLGLSVSRCTRAQDLKLVNELLRSNGLVRDEVTDRWHRAAPPEKADLRDQIKEFLEKSGVSTAREIQKALEAGARDVSRSLATMARSGHVTRFGRGISTVYLLGVDPLEET